jgi:hypothetical protein
MRLKRPEASRGPWIVIAPDRSRKPEIRNVPLEPRRHHADHSPRLAVQDERAADDPGVRAEERHPGPIVHDADGRCARRSVRLAKRPSEQGLHTEKREAVRGHPRDRQALRAGVADPVHGLAAGADDVFEGLCLLLIIQELRGREIGTPEVAIGRVLQDDIHQAIRPRVGKRIEDDVAKHTVDDRDRADAKRERDDGDGGETARFRECADAVGEVSPQIFQHGESKPSLG